MNYALVYESLINTRRNRQLDINEYYEVHHIIPRSMGGSNEKENLIHLTAREHYIAHRLLYKIHNNSKMAAAWFFMCTGDIKGRETYSSKHYERARKAHSKHMKKTMKGSGNHFYGKQHTNESKAKIGKANKNRVKSQTEIDNWVKKVASKPKNAQHRKKLGKSKKGMLTLKNIVTLETIFIKHYHKNLYSNAIWKTTYIASRILNKYVIVTCPHCKKESESNNATFSRWHFDNCKMKPGYVKPKTRKYNIERFWQPWYNKPTPESDFVYNKLFEIEQIVLANKDLSGKKAMNILTENISTNKEHRYYIMACRKAILDGKFNEQSKNSLIKKFGENYENQID